MAKMVKVTATKPNALCLIPTITWGKERKDSCELFFESTHVLQYVCMHIRAHTNTQYKKKVKAFFFLTKLTKKK